MIGKIIFTIALAYAFLISTAQTHIDQNGWKSSVSNPISASSTQPMRYEIANLGYNSHHWQYGGVIFIELFQSRFATGYAKYVLENGYLQGAQAGSPALRLLEAYGIRHNARVQLGTPSDLATSSGGYVNKKLPVYVDIKDGCTYRVKITYLQTRTDDVTDQNQLSFTVAPAGIATPSFTASSVTDQDISGSGNLKITGVGNHYISNGNVGIGTAAPNEKLSVNGNIRAKQIKVEAANWPDYVFDSSYQLMPLQGVEKFIRQKGHLPEIPSAKDVEQSGIELGSNQALLLKKIEELTLYLIDLKKENQELKKRMLELEHNMKHKQKTNAK